MNRWLELLDELAELHPLAKDNGPNQTIFKDTWVKKEGGKEQ